MKKDRHMLEDEELKVEHSKTIPVKREKGDELSRNYEIGPVISDQWSIHNSPDVVHSFL